MKFINRQTFLRLHNSSVLKKVCKSKDEDCVRWMVNGMRLSRSMPSFFASSQATLPTAARHCHVARYWSWNCIKVTIKIIQTNKWYIFQPPYLHCGKCLFIPLRSLCTKCRYIKLKNHPLAFHIALTCPKVVCESQNEHVTRCSIWKEPYSNTFLPTGAM
jgi:hypothetical protein